jgi:hypothetical protein
VLFCLFCSVVLPERRNRDGGGASAQQQQHNQQQSAFDQGGLDDFAAAEEDLAVYTWGEEGYDGLGDALMEEGDDFNDDTFGGGEIGTYSPSPSHERRQAIRARQSSS